MSTGALQVAYNNAPGVEDSSPVVNQHLCTILHHLYPHTTIVPHNDLHVYTNMVCAYMYMYR